MKKIKLAMALTAAMVASSAVNATNQLVEVEVGVTAYIASGLSTTVSPMVFGAVVAPTSGAATPSWVNVDCFGTPTYSPNGSPSGVGNIAQNTGDSSPATPGVGSIVITGEPDYAISVTVASGATSSADVEFFPFLNDDCANTPDLANAQLNGSGELALSLYGRLEVKNTWNPATPAEKNITTNAKVTINYR